MDEREQEILKLSEGLLARIEKKGDLDEAQVDAEFLFRFEIAWCQQVSQMRRALHALLGQTGDGRLSIEDSARLWLHLRENAGLETWVRGSELVINNNRGAYHILDEQLKAAHDASCGDIRRAVENPQEAREEFETIWRRMWEEAGATVAVQRDLGTQGFRYGILPLEHQYDEFAPKRLAQQLERLEHWVMQGALVPEFLWDTTRLIETQIAGKDTRIIRLEQWRGPFPESSARLALGARIRTWAIYFLSRRGGGALEESLAIQMWNDQFPNRRVVLDGHEAQCARLFDLGSCRGASPIWCDSFDSLGRRWGVLIGVDNYQGGYPSLSACVRDVQAVHHLLVRSGFDESYATVLTEGEAVRARIFAELQRAANATEKDDLLFFYFSGHGCEKGGEAYLIPYDGFEPLSQDTAVSITRVKQIVRGAPARAKVMVLDACHSGAALGAKAYQPMSEEFFERVFQEAEGIAILASCKQGEVSRVLPGGEQSVFTKFLLEALRGDADLHGKGFVTVQDTNLYVCDRVKRWAAQHHYSQTPTLQAAVAGDIPLVSCSSTKQGQRAPITR